MLNGEETMSEDWTYPDQLPPGIYPWKGEQHAMQEIAPPVSSGSVDDSFPKSRQTPVSESDGFPIPEHNQALEEPILTGWGLYHQQHPQQPVQIVSWKTKPEWWTNPWEMLCGYRPGPVGAYLRPMGPARFQEENFSDIMSFVLSNDRVHTGTVNGVETRTTPGPGNDLVGSTIAVAWSEARVTMIKKATQRGLQLDRALAV
jgi:hypothetical protein